MGIATDASLSCFRKFLGLWPLAVLAFVADVALAQDSKATAATAAPPLTGEVSIQTSVAMCMGCHGIEGYRASFPEVHRVPKISGQNAKYIEAALKAYASGERRHPTMRGISAALDEKEMSRIAEYYSRPATNYSPGRGAPAAPPTASVARLLQKGGCVSCHGQDFNSPVDPTYPKLGGQYPDYLFVVLKSYKADPNRVVGRSHPIMSALVRQFSNSELKAMADYIGSLPGDLGVQSAHPLRPRSPG